METEVIYRSYVEYLLKYLETRDMSKAEALADCSFAKDKALPKALSDADLEILLRNVKNKLGYEAFQVGFNLGFQLNTPDHGIVGLASLCSETVAQSLQTYSDYFQIISPVFRLVCYEEAPYFVCESICEKNISSPAYDFLMALGLANGGLIGLNVIGYDAAKHKQKTRMEIAEFPKPNKALWKLFKSVADISFDHESTRLKIPQNIAEQKMATANAATRAAVIRLCEQELEKIQGDFLACVQTKIKNNLSQPLNAVEMAADFSMSERSFHRKLKNHGTSYGKLCIEIKMDEAKKLLSQKELSIKEIAFLLGYSEVTNFSSAFKKQQGSSPKHYRENFYAYR